MSTINFTEYTSKIPDNSRLVFEEEVKRLLGEKSITTISTDEIMDLIDQVKGEVDLKHQYLLDLIKKLPTSQSYNLMMIKNIMTMDGRLLVHNDKNNLITDKFLKTKVSDHFDSMEPMYNDPRKNAITCSKLIKNTNDGYAIPLFSIVTEPMRRNKTIPNNNIGKLLLEVRISTPLMNFKGNITTGMIENGYGIGFFADYCKSVDENDLQLIAMKSIDNVTKEVTITFLVKKKQVKVLIDNTYDNLLPFNMDISVHIGKDLKLEESLIKINTIYNDDVIGFCNLNSNGHGPIDCDFLNKTRYIKSKYYPGNTSSVQCVTNSPMTDKLKSKFFNLKIQPSSYGNSPSEVADSHILKSNSGSHNFDMYNLLREVYDFTDNIMYKCFGHIVINGLIVPVSGFIMEFSSGSVKFLISMNYKIPDTMKRYVNDPNETNGLREPFIIFQTNSNIPFGWTRHNGFIGDNCNNDKVTIGEDSYVQSYYKPMKDYELSLIDINIELIDSTGLINKLKWNKPFRYSGDFNKYTHDFKKNDHDTFPFPSNTRNIDDLQPSEIDIIPALNSDNIVMSFVDNPDIMVGYVDNVPANGVIQFVDNNFKGQ